VVFDRNAWDEATPSEPDPPLDDLLGHVFDGSYVHKAFRGVEGRQFYLSVIDGARDRVHGDWLAEGCTWRRLDGGPHPDGNYCNERIAIHEAGHAVTCVDQGIKVEYVTGVPFFCQYDYRLRDRLKADRATWGEKLIRASLGGPEAERIFWEWLGQLPADDTQRGWSDDFSEARWQIMASDGSDLAQLDHDSFMERLHSPAVQSELVRLQDVVRQRLLQPAIWGPSSGSRRSSGPKVPLTAPRFGSWSRWLTPRWGEHRRPQRDRRAASPARQPRRGALVTCPEVGALAEGHLPAVAGSGCRGSHDNGRWARGAGASQPIPKAVMVVRPHDNGRRARGVGASPHPPQVCPQAHLMTTAAGLVGQVF
jgi:hypothetical protein